MVPAAVKVFNQWRTWPDDYRGFVLFSIGKTPDFFFLCFLNFTFEWPLSEMGRAIHESMSRA